MNFETIQTLNWRTVTKWHSDLRVCDIITCHELAISLLFFYLFFSFLLASVPISPHVLMEPSTLLTLIHDTSFRRLIHPFRFYSALLHSEPFAIGWLSI